MTPETYATKTLQSFKFAYRASDAELLDDLCKPYRTAALQERLNAGEPLRADEYSPEERCIREVWNYLDAAHHEQSRKGPLPLGYKVHLYMVTKQRQLDGADLEGVVTGMGHDCPEDGFISDKGYKAYIKENSIDQKAYEREMRQVTRAGLKELVCKHGFDGERVVSDIADLTNPPAYPDGMSKLEWQFAHFKTMPQSAQMTKLADKIANSYDSAHNVPTGFDTDKLASIIPVTEDMLAEAGHPEKQTALYAIVKDDLETVIDMRRAQDLNEEKER